MHIETASENMLVVLENICIDFVTFFLFLKQFTDLNNLRFQE